MGERTKDLFEKIEGYPEAEQLTSKSFDYRFELSKMTSYQRFIFNLYFKLSGFNNFNKQLPENFEDFLRTIDVKGGALYAPVISATITLIDDNRELSPIERASTLICATISLKEDLFSGKLSPDLYKGQPLEMGQYPNLFATSQIIDKNKARIYKSELKDQITVISNGYFYIVDLINIDPNKDINIIIQCLEQIVIDSKKNNNKSNYLSPGVITAARNKVQLRIFNRLLQKDVNNSSINLLKESLFTICLDLDSNPESYEETAKVSHIENQFNRWFHSSLQLVVFNNSKAGLIINFSANISGNNMMRAASEICLRSQSLKLNDSLKIVNKDSSRIKRLNWEVEHIHIKNAEISLNSVRDHSNNFASFTIKNIGKKSFNKYEKHTVPLFVLALQSASKIFVNHHPKIIQFLTMSKYRFMDLARTNITTEENMEFVNYINQKNFDKIHAIKKLDRAVESQIRRMRECRDHISIQEQIMLFLMTRKGLSKLFNYILHWVRILLLRFSNYFKGRRTEIIISHPKIYKEVPIIGRPGVRIPYAKYFGLHYQIMENNINITIMPGINWIITNEKFIGELENQLKKILKIIES